MSPSERRKRRRRLDCQSLSLSRLTSLVDDDFICRLLFSCQIIDGRGRVRHDEHGRTIELDTFRCRARRRSRCHLRCQRNPLADLVSLTSSFPSFKYLGSVEVLCSMKTLDFDKRTRVARDSIRLVCAAAGVDLHERHKVSVELVSPRECMHVGATRPTRPRSR